MMIGGDSTKLSHLDEINDHEVIFYYIIEGISDTRIITVNRFAKGMECNSLF